MKDNGVLQMVGTAELIRGAFRKFRHDDDGGPTTIEFVLWLPVFILILALVIDVCFVFLAQARMFDVASDAARRRALGYFGTDSAASTYLSEQSSFRGKLPVTANVVSSGVQVVATVEFLADDLDVVGILGFLTSDKLSAVVTQLKEPS